MTREDLERLIQILWCAMQYTDKGDCYVDARTLIKGLDAWASEITPAVSQQEQGE